MKIFVAGVAVLLAVGVAGGQDEAAKKDLKAMDGTWTVAALEMGGKEQSGENIKTVDIKLEIKDAKYAMHFGGKKAGAGTIKLNAAKTPRQIDIVVEEGMGQGTTMPGIYKFDGETMIVCVNQPGMERPTEFKTKEGTGQLLISYKRVKK